MTLRTATRNDIPRMTELLAQLFEIEVDFRVDPEKQARGLERLLQTPSALIFVAECSGVVVGMCTLQIQVSTASGTQIGALEDVVIDSAYRGQGIGASLLQAVEEWAMANDLARLQLQADKDNTPALDFYQKQNWESTNLMGWMKPLSAGENKKDLHKADP